jgi:hypothetical protein
VGCTPTVAGVPLFAPSLHRVQPLLPPPWGTPCGPPGCPCEVRDTPRLQMQPATTLPSRKTGTLSSTCGRGAARTGRALSGSTRGTPCTRAGATPRAPCKCQCTLRSIGCSVEENGVATLRGRYGTTMAQHVQNGCTDNECKSYNECKSSYTTPPLHFLLPPAKEV